jgi:hypothetical protein
MRKFPTLFQAAGNVWVFDAGFKIGPLKGHPEHREFYGEREI